MVQLCVYSCLTKLSVLFSKSLNRTVGVAFLVGSSTSCSTLCGMSRPSQPVPASWFSSCKFGIIVRDVLADVRDRLSSLLADMDGAVCTDRLEGRAGGVHGRLHDFFQ